ncbi:hypothetical protein [Sphingomonas alba]|uniref:DUF4956 domain-containing protein n=1 Tax=Sphingomonas alba TaxID=2908208 RepID=A0ABT0RLJ5_9SPHN|nr:hypothetical protein [Sphingomonas alba]MCL6683159.1 hypothetical protein [Sphingomonas alba]
MKAFKLFVQLTIYYVVIFGGAWLLVHNNPGVQSYLPIGGAQELINSGSGKSSALEAVSQAAHVKSIGQSLGWLTVAILGALITSFPVTWVYMGTRTQDEYDQSIISTILILPSVVTSIVVVVQHSLALAFALGGIAGAVRFKNSLKSSGDALYILLAVGIGLASGIGAVEAALVMSLAFNYCFLALWISEYGEREGMKRYMSDFNPEKGQASMAAKRAAEAPTEGLPPG